MTKIEKLIEKFLSDPTKLKYPQIEKIAAECYKKSQSL